MMEVMERTEHTCQNANVVLASKLTELTDAVINTATENAKLKERMVVFLSAINELEDYYITKDLVNNLLEN